MAYDPYKATFEIGTRVRVVKQRKYPNEKLLGLTGTVRNDSGSSVAVVLDSVTNTRSSYGCFYFRPVELIEVDENNDEIMEEKNMKSTNRVVNYLNIAKVKFVNMDDRSGMYQYANFEFDLKTGDLCVVRTEDEKILVAEVVELIDVNDVEMYREVVAKIHTGGYDTRVECRRKAAELKEKMEARAKQLQDVALYQMLAKDDSEMAELLREYQGIPQV